MADKKLWEVMLGACLQAADDHPHQVNACYAAELRALADEVAPEEPRPTDFIHSSVEALIASAQWEQRMATRALLLDAADEAEREGNA